ncbi:MAG: GNAT family N-acetyltransferase [Planctomycetaceae bacterium]|nr:GNAT family N-acetyltransferase [Planctomycetaceae bacterium]
MTFDYCVLTPETDEAFNDTVGRTFRYAEGYWETFRRRIGPENVRTVSCDGRVVGGLGIYRPGQWFGGREVPCAGVAAVGISPSDRGGGVAEFLMRSLLEELHAEGTPVATLFASTQRLYRKVGFEHAGSRYGYSLPMTAIGVRDEELSVTEVSLDSSKPFEAITVKRALATNGNLQRTPGLWERILQHADGHQAGYVIGDTENPEGYLINRYDVDHEGTGHLHIRDMAALTPAAGRRLWSFLAVHRSTIPWVHWYGPAVDPLLCLTAECKSEQTEVLRWMTRIVDVPQAFSSRGYPADVSGELHLDVHDDVLPANHGRFVLAVAEGRGTVVPGGRGDLRADVRGLAPLFSGFLPPQTLRAIGCLDGDAATLQIASRLLAGPEPWMPEIF